jgi:hypothetical protein
MMAMGAGIRGNRVVGGTDERHRALKVNPTTLLPDASGIVLRPEHVHHALRRLAGIDQDDVITKHFPLATDELAVL